MTPFDWTFLIWDRLGDPALDVTVRQVNLHTARLEQGNQVVGQISISAPHGAAGHDISGGPSAPFVYPRDG